MKALIYCYSNTGNTRLACDYIISKIPAVDFRVHDIKKDGFADPAKYDVIGFAAFADFLKPSPLFLRFIAQLPLQREKPAFVLNTYGNLNGATLSTLVKAVRKRGFTVDAHALHTPENIATMICMGIANEQYPNEKQMIAFNQFIERLTTKINTLQKKDGNTLRPFKLPLNDRLLPGLPRSFAKSAMGNKFIDEALCTRCGICVNECPADAIVMDSVPVFTESKCEYCWTCYNKCPQKAVYTKKYRGRGHYPKPIPALMEKLQAR